MKNIKSDSFDQFDKVKAAHNNDSKVESRKIIVDTIKKVFPLKDVSFVEFLGAGNGAEYYASNLKISRMLLIEKEKKDFRLFAKHKYRNFCRAHYPMVTELWNDDLQNHIRFVNPFFWNVINLDFCAYCYEYKDGADGSPLSLIEEFFRCGFTERNNSLLITSFMIGGYSLRIASRHNKTIYSDEASITKAVTELAAKYGYKLQKVLSNIYDSNPKTSMINLGFVVR